ncbi:MAG: efflux RND transporter periplasmic adaptor subunit [Phascolarctobacterium sp.]|nr:efflux RND transporter periplasmic adaptor subunit [Candidatus Phascolarctobacterium caballi]
MDRKIKFVVTICAVVGTFLLGGCGKQEQANRAPMVRSMSVIVRDTPVAYDYTGFIEANQEMNVVAQVSGQIKEKYFRGGEYVSAGAWLYKIDQRNYSANLLSAKSAYLSAQADAERYTNLYAKNAVSKQTLDNIITQRDVAHAKYISAQKDFDETIVKAPFSGRIDTTALEVGNYADAGKTTLTKISDTNPVYVKFSIAEPEYMELSKGNSNGGTGLRNLYLVLANGERYELPGEVTEVNRGISDATGSMTVRALFKNPNKKLLPGMFAHISATGGTLENALLVPQRALVELLYKKFVFVLDNDKKVSMREVKLGQNVGRLVVVKEGLQAGETVIVEGTGKIRNGMAVNALSMSEEDLDTTKQQGAQ